MNENLRRKLVALSRIINETSDKVDEFQGMCFAADSHYPEGKKVYLVRAEKTTWNY